VFLRLLGRGGWHKICDLRDLRLVFLRESNSFIFRIQLKFLVCFLVKILIIFLPEIVGGGGRALPVPSLVQCPYVRAS
jgi:hypothetical protein